VSNRGGEGTLDTGKLEEPPGRRRRETVSRREMKGRMAEKTVCIMLKHSDTGIMGGGKVIRA